QEVINSKKIDENINKEFQSWINEYQTISDELAKKQKEVSDTYKLFETKYDLEEKLENKNEEINATKEELKQKNPSYARAQQRFLEQQKNKKYAKFYQPISNK
ncbi:DNA double-strand break repair protein Rad50, partial ['Crotalaria aegyptiaca' phytoplasma]|nr:DNA double-strand break repair protein Rad50 ['Crotalaria aegyptiaca' phytoplasma]